MATKALKSTPAAASTSVAVKKPASTSVVSIQEQLKAQVAAMNEKIAAPSGINIGITQSKEFRLPDGTKTDQLEVVIVDFASINLFYEGAYDKDAITPPACFAIGSNPLVMVPSANSPSRQADACKGCAMNEFGSAGKGKACKNMRVLAVLPADADESTPMWLLKVSPTAIRAFDAYVRSVASTFQLPPVAVVTTLSFNEDVDYSSLVFSNPVPNENVGVHFARQDEARALLETEPDTTQRTAAAPAKGVKKPAAKAPVRR